MTPGAAGAGHEIRGFTVKISPREGNGTSSATPSPVFLIRDPHKFPDLNHVVKLYPPRKTRNVPGRPEPYTPRLMIRNLRGLNPAIPILTPLPRGKQHTAPVPVRGRCALLVSNGK